MLNRIFFTIYIILRFNPNGPPEERGVLNSSLRLVKGTWQNNYDVYKAATPEELQEFLHPGALWKKFQYTVRQQLLRQAEKGQARRVTAVIESGSAQESEAIVDSGYSSAYNGHNCTFCNEPLPTIASATLISLCTVLNRAVLKRRTKKNSPVVTALYMYCAQHTAEALYEAQPQDAKWPINVNFAELGYCVENLMDKLQVVWTRPQDNYFYKALCLWIGQDG